MEQEPKENRAGCSSAPVTGYATKVDAALAWADNKPGTDWGAVRETIGTLTADADAEASRVAETLAAEVRRLCNLLGEASDEIDACGGVSARFREESHNNEAHPRREAEGGVQ